jgi:hypothetical protein
MFVSKFNGQGPGWAPLNFQEMVDVHRPGRYRGFEMPCREACPKVGSSLSEEKKKLPRQENTTAGLKYRAKAYVRVGESSLAKEKRTPPLKRKPRKRASAA